MPNSNATTLEQIEEQPLGLPPPGIESNFNNPTTRATETFVSAAICFALIFGFAGARFYTKAFILRCREKDDCM